MQWCLSLCLFLVIVPPAWPAAPPSQSFLLRPVMIPIEVIPSGHIAIHAKINGYGPYRFIFDTGAPALVISEQVAKESHILPADFTKPFFTPLGNLGNFDVASISVGRATQAHLQADIWNHPTVEILSRSFGRFEGLIGFPFFARYAVTIDYKSKTMSLVPCDFKPQDTQQKMIYRLSDPVTEKTWAPTQQLGIRVTKPATDSAAGVVVASVLPGSPAADAGFIVGDRLLTLDGRWTDTIQDCYAALSGVESARAVRVSVQRNGQKIKMMVQVEPGI